MQSRELIAGSLGKNFHAAIVIVAHPSSDAQDVRFPLDKPAEADSLHASADDEALGQGCMFCGSHKKLLIVNSSLLIENLAAPTSLVFNQQSEINNQQWP